MGIETVDPSELLLSELEAHIAVAQASRDMLAAPFGKLVELAFATLAEGKQLLFFGNGGSAADAQHWATELTVRYRFSRPAIPAIALTTDGSALTAIGNDFGFEKIFSRQIEAIARPGDLAVGISTSGQSPNVIAGVEQARAKGCRTAVFTGSAGVRLAQLADVALVIPSRDTARIQELHAIIGHTLCHAIEHKFQTEAKFARFQDDA